MILNIVLWLVGVIALGLSIWRIRRPFGRLSELDRLAENSRRYDSWRGNRLAADRTSGADVMREMLRREVIVWGVIGVAGIVMIVAGFAIR